MDSFRYYVALLLVVAVPPALLFWFIVHPFARFWRRLGATWTHTLLWPILVSGMAALFTQRGWLLRVEYGINGILVAAGATLILLSAWMLAILRRHLTLATQMGMPELSSQGAQRLLTGGIYARLRHPRYVQMEIALLGWALIANYLAAYLLLLGSIPLVYLIVLLEERELRDRFGDAYEQYSRRVPRFFPRFGRPVLRSGEWD